MPVFDGGDPDGWILRAERYFRFYRLSENDKIEAAVVSMEGDALKWFQWENRRHPISSWGEMKEFMLKQFRPTNVGSLYEQWLATGQTTTVLEYRRQFIEKAAPLEQVPESILMGEFIQGLKQDIQHEIRAVNPYTLEQTMDLALRIDERNRAAGVKRAGPTSSKQGSYSIYNNSPVQNPRGYYGTQSSPSGA